MLFVPFCIFHCFICVLFLCQNESICQVLLPLVTFRHYSWINFASFPLPSYTFTYVQGEGNNNKKPAAEAGAMDEVNSCVLRLRIRPMWLPRLELELSRSLLIGVGHTHTHTHVKYSTLAIHYLQFYGLNPFPPTHRGRHRQKEKERSCNNIMTAKCLP